MELEDQSWFPTYLRDQQTAFIGFVASKFGIYTPLISVLQKLSAAEKSRMWIDCCSGSAGPVIFLQEKINFTGDILLTDKFPNKNSSAKLPNIEYLNMSLDVLQDDIPNKGFITIFNAFHHFNKKERLMIVEKLKCSNRTFLIVEILQPTFLDGIKVFITAIFGQILLSPFVKPFSIKRLIFTYLFPVNIITVLWDGIASVLRAIPFIELKQLAESLDGNGFDIKSEKLKTPLAVITYLVGKPVQTNGK